MNEKERDKIRKQLRKLGNDFLEALREEVDSSIILCDVERLDRLISIVHMSLDSQLLQALRNKGLDKEIRELCDLAGRKVEMKEKPREAKQ